MKSGEAQIVAAQAAPSEVAIRAAGLAAALPGYALHERLGGGGCGEVWRATAPGGLSKAVKIVSNFGDSAEACAELKALRRVTELHHPFLLSVERADQCDNFLYIVTELAERSLRDRLRQRRDEGQVGIPRDELLGYLREAAEALDYLWQRHNLQHLDVKPENLLLVAGHIKVADFGLLKRLSDTNVSVVAGLTPRYAPPELFDGRPSPQSDQYSLAVVYQELATGKYPFDGRTTAQLASQHLHVKPDLSPLTPTERFAVGRALSKDPKARFASCHEFVERLVPKSGTQILAPSVVADGRTPRGTDSDPVVGCSQHDGRTVMVSPAAAQKLPPLPLAGARAEFRPTLFLGVGHTGGQVLRRLRRLLADQCRRTEPWPALPMLYFDTDAGAIRSVTDEGGELPLTEAETLLLPLYNTVTYRERKVLAVPSISRRWIYNVPRSKRTEGVRMLGRLALVDHLDQVMDRVRRALVDATGLEAATATATISGLPFLPVDPRVFIIGSLGGGTGSGIVIDLAYLVRQVLAELGFSDDHVVGLLTYGVRVGTTRELAAGNAYACLAELEHFSQGQNDYPGEPLLGLAGFREARGAFADAYLVDLGDNLADEQFDEGVHALATYLQLSATSAAAVFFDLARRSGAADAPGHGLSVRSFCLQSLARNEGTAATRYVDALCRLVVYRWRGAPTAGATESAFKPRSAPAAEPEAAPHNVQALAQAAAERCLAECGLPSLEARLRQATTELVEHDPLDLSRRLADHALAQADDSAWQTPERAAALLRPLHAALGTGDGAAGNHDSPLRALIGQVAETVGHELGARLGVWTAACVNDEQLRVAGARETVQIVRRRLGQWAQAANAAAAQARGNGDRLRGLLTEPPAAPGAAPVPVLDRRGVLHEYVAELVTQMFAGGLAKAFNVVDAHAHGSADELRNLWKELGQLADAFTAEVPQHEGERGTGSPEQPLFGPEQWLQQKSRLIDAVDAELTALYAHENGGLLEALRRGGERRVRLAVALREAARGALRKAAGELIEARLRESLAEPERELPPALCEALARLDAADGCAGARRLFLTLSKALAAAPLVRRIEQAAGVAPNVLDHCADEVIVGVEFESSPPDAFRRRLLAAAPCCDELAARLHGRCDVVWSSHVSVV